MSTDKVKAKIQELCPDVMEIKEGCQVMAGLGNPMLHTIYAIDEGVISAYLNKPFPKELEANEFYDCEWENSDWNGIEILGSPITLATVIRAYHERSDAPDNDVSILGIVSRWRLADDNYDAQNEQAKQYIGALLGVV